jgi:hypothetical protein
MQDPIEQIRLRLNAGKQLFIYMAAEKRNYGVYKITNNMPNAKRKTYYIVSSIQDTSHLIATVRGMKTSSTANGGAKAIANDMASIGKNYKDKFSVTKMRSGMTKHDATVYRNSLKAGSKKTYNTPRS